MSPGLNFHVTLFTIHGIRDTILNFAGRGCAGTGCNVSTCAGLVCAGAGFRFSVGAGTGYNNNFR